MANNKKRAYKKHFKPRSHRGQGQSKGTATIQLDYDALPSDMNEEQYTELVESLPPYKKKTKPKALQHAELQGKNLGELHEVAAKEKTSDFVGRNRRDAIWEITRERLRRHSPIVVHGTVDSGGNGHTFLRSPFNDYMPATDDVFLPPSIIEKFGLERGMTVTGRLRPPADGEKYLCLWEVEKVDHGKPDDARGRSRFKELVPLYPEQRILLEGTEENPLEMRIVDLITPLGRGQRGLIVAPPRTGKTVLLHMLAKSIVHNAPDIKLIILLVDERPEEVTDFERTIEGRARRSHQLDVRRAGFTPPAGRRDGASKKPRRWSKRARTSCILLDSITRLARACNVEAPSNGKLLSGGIGSDGASDAEALLRGRAEHRGRRFADDPRNRALIETGSKMDEVIFEEFKGTGNMELVLDRRLSDRRIFPAIDINRSGTRKEELLFTARRDRAAFGCSAKCSTSSIPSKRWRC